MRVIQLARKPLQGTLVSNLTKYHTGALCIHGTRIGSEVRINQPAGNKGGQSSYNMGVYGMPQDASSSTARGRWPANVIFQHNVGCDVDKTKCVCYSFGGIPETRSGKSKQIHPAYPGKSLFMNGYSNPFNQHGDSGSVLRFFKQIKE